MSLTGYEIDIGCERYKYEWMKKWCAYATGQAGHTDREQVHGWHSFFVLKDQVCNLEEQT